MYIHKVRPVITVIERTDLIVKYLNHVGAECIMTIKQFEDTFIKIEE